MLLGSYFNKMLGIGPGGINCGCCVDFSPRKGKNHKKMYSRKRRKVEKEFFRREINLCQRNHIEMKRVSLQERDLQQVDGVCLEMISD